MSERQYKCPYCDKRYTRSALIGHIDNKHEDEIPENFTATRVVFNLVNKKTTGHCVVCGKETLWNEKVGKYNRLCGDPKCTKTLRDKAQKNHIRVYGVSTLLNDPYHQEKMLEHRKISGKYKFADGGVHTYTGNYEKKCLEFFDKVMGASSNDIISPGPVLEYKYKGQVKKYITDIYYVPYNLIIECKDGGDNPNKREMKEYREKQIAKETMVTNQGEYNYLRLTNNNFEQLLEILAELKMNLIDGDKDKKVVKIYEHFLNEDSKSDDDREFKEWLRSMYIKESEWKAKHRSIYINIWRNMRNKCKGLQKEYGPDTVILWEGDENNMIKHMDAFRGGPNDRRDGIMMKSLSICAIVQKNIPVFKRKSVLKNLEKDLNSCIPKQYLFETKEGKEKITFRIMTRDIDGAKYFYFIASSIILNESTPVYDGDNNRNGVFFYKFYPSYEIQTEPKVGVTYYPDADTVLTIKDGEFSMDSISSNDKEHAALYKYNKNLELGNLIINNRNKNLSEFKNIYELITGSEMLCEDQMDYDDRFTRVDFSDFIPKTSIIESSIIDTARTLMNKNFEIPVCDLKGIEYRDEIKNKGLLSEDCNLYSDLNGYFIKNEVTGNRSKSYKSVDQIPEQEIKLVGKKDIFEDTVFNNDGYTSIRDTINSDIPAMDMPFFTPEELMNFGYYDGESNCRYNVELDLYGSDLSCSDWFDSYNNLYNGIYTENYSKLYQEWNELLTTLQCRLESSIAMEDEESIEEIKEDMISLGWNPVMEFNTENKIKASNRVRDIMESKLIEFDDIDRISIDESKEIEKHYNPVYICLVGGKAIFSEVIKAYSKSPFSHAAIGFQSNLKKLFSFNANYQDQHGFSEESIDGYNKDSNIAVFVLFVNDKVKHNMEKVIKDFKKNRDKAKYSFAQVLALPFNKALSTDYKMICSQFVDHLLKSVNIDFNKKASGVTTPADLYKSFIFNNKVFNVFEGKIKDYDPKRVDKRVKVMHKDIGLTVESSIQEADFPIQFNKDGDLLIKHIKVMKPNDYETEFARSHKILKAAEKSNNLESMKYELAKLWFLNLSIENKLNSRVPKVKNREDYHKARSKILNDYTKYLEYIQKKDKDFVFGDYYTNSEFNIYETKINKNTLNNGIGILKQIVK